MMRYGRSTLSLSLIIGLMCLNGQTVYGQESDDSWQARQALTTNIELGAKTRLQLFGKFEEGLDYSYHRFRTGAMVTYRFRRILTLQQRGIDKEDEHTLIIGGGYEFLARSLNDQTTREHRITVEATPRYPLPAGFVASDRNRLEMRWVDAKYNARYRNRFSLSRPLNRDGFRSIPYGMVELFYDRNLHSWNVIHYGFGVQVPTKRRFMVDGYYLRQECSSCRVDPVNIVGVSLNVYLNSKN